MPRTLAVSGVLLVLVMFLAGPSASAQVSALGAARGGGPGQVPRDRPARDTAKTGTAVLRGHVLAADSGQPLRRAQVRIFASELREGRVTATDAQGAYEFKELPAGRYTIAATKGSYVALQYGQRRPLEPGKPLEVADGQTIEKVDFSLPRGSVITGRVFDEFGDPASDVQVMVQRYQYVQGSRRLVNAGRPGMTNDIGEFRVFGLPPGQYYLSASLRPFQMQATGDDRTGYAPTYYPGVPNPESAQKLTVGIGQVLADLVMTLTPTRTARITGTAVTSDGRPLTGMVMLLQRSGVGFTTMGAPLRTDGSFTMNGVVPGEYILQAGERPGSDAEAARTEVTVAGNDVTDVRLVAARPVTITGRIVVDPAGAAAFRPQMHRVFVSPIEPQMMMMMGVGPTAVNDDLTFSIKARPGRMRIDVSPGEEGEARFTTRAVRVNGADVTDTGIDVRPGEDVSGVEIEVTNRIAELSGTVTDAGGTPLKDYSVVVFPRDRDRWTTGSRYLRTGRPDQEGRFRISPLPPGDYAAVALEYIEPGEGSDPEFLDRIEARATRFTIGEGETRTITLRISPSS